MHASNTWFAVYCTGLERIIQNRIIPVIRILLNNNDLRPTLRFQIGPPTPAAPSPLLVDFYDIATMEAYLSNFQTKCVFSMCFEAITHAHAFNHRFLAYLNCPLGPLFGKMSWISVSLIGRLADPVNRHLSRLLCPQDLNFNHR